MSKAVPLFLLVAALCILVAFSFRSQNHYTAIKSQVIAIFTKEAPPPANEIRVYGEDFTLLPNKTLIVPRKMRCSVSNLSDENEKNVIRKHGPKELLYSSQLSEPVELRIWFYDEGGNCEKDFDKLNALKVFI